MRKLLLVFFLSFISISAHSSSFKVVFINPGNAEHNNTGDFWSNVTLFMSAAASDLNIELVTIYSNRNHIFMKSLADKVIDEKPEFVILVNEKGQALDLIKKITSAAIPIFSLLNRISESDYEQLSDQQKALLKGSVVPDNFIVGKKLITSLINKHSTTSKNTKNINLLALQGDFTTPASISREQGLLAAISTINNVNLIDSTVANWSSNQAYVKVKGILQRTHIDIIWAANDPMAVGAKKAISELNLTYPALIGGVNWDVENIEFPIDFSFGGHVTLGAQAMVMLEAIYNNVLPPEQINQMIDIFESSSSEHYPLFIERLANNQVEHYDFTKFSYLNNKNGNKPLNFTIENLLSVFDNSIK